METLRPLIVVMLLLMAVVAGVSQTVASEPQQTNLLSNPSFEDPYEGGAAAGWSRWHRDSQVKPESCSDAYAFTPQWSRETNGALVRDGSVSQHIGNQYDTWNAGVMQTVNVTPGTTYRFSFWAIGRASNEQFPVASDTAVNLGVRAGFDPNGSGLWTDADVVWGGAVSPHDSGNQANWQQAVVEATATGNQVTVFVSANLMGANNCRAHLDVWFDAAQLVEVGPPPTETPPPQPTVAPQPTAAATLPPAATATTEAEVTPTNTPVPTDTPTSTPEPPSTGLLCVNAFGDVNADGQKDANEGAMAGVTFTVAQSSQIVARGVSSGPEPVCFDLEPGDYQVVQEVPPTLEMTTGAVAGITLGEGQTVRVEFGSRVRQQTASTGTGDDEIVAAPPDPAGSADSEEQTATAGSWLAYSGLAVLFLAIVLLGGLLYYLLRQRA